MDLPIWTLDDDEPTPGKSLRDLLLGWWGAIGGYGMTRVAEVRT